MHLGYPREVMQQDRDPHPIPGASLNPGWVQDGVRAERRSAEPEKHHSGLHFIAMATSWKPYRIRAPEHQIREAAVGRMVAPCGQTSSPGAWGWDEHGAWWHFHPIRLTTVLLLSPSHQCQKKTQFTFLKPTSPWDPPPERCCIVGCSQATCKSRRKMREVSFHCLQNRTDADGRSGEGDGTLGRKSAPNPLCEMASPDVGCGSARSPCAGQESLISF